MPTVNPGTAGPATKAQIARNGHVAAVFRQLLKERDWTPRDFNRAIGRPIGHTGIYVWLAAKGAPNSTTAALINKTLGIPISDMTPVGDAINAGGVSTKKNGRSVVARSAGSKTWVEPPANAPVPHTTVVAPTPRRLYFSVDGDGMATLKLDVIMPVEQLFPVLTILYNAGLVAQKQVEPP